MEISRCNANSIIVLGVLKVIVGAILLLVALVGTAASSVQSMKIDIVVLNGIGFVVPGILGIVAGVKKNRKIVVAYTLTSGVFFFLIGIGCIMSVKNYAKLIDVFKNWRSYCTDYGSGCRCYSLGASFQIADSCQSLSSSKYVGVLIALAIFLCFAGVLLLVSAIVGWIAYRRSLEQPFTTLVEDQPQPPHEFTYPQNCAPPQYFPQLQCNENAPQMRMEGLPGKAGAP